MTYLVACKPCGCIGAWCGTTPTEPESAGRFRLLYEREGCVVREVDDIPPPIKCSHGTVAAQLVAERATLVKWLGERIAETDCLHDTMVREGRVLSSAIPQTWGKALRDVLARVEGKESDHA